MRLGTVFALVIVALMTVASSERQRFAIIVHPSNPIESITKERVSRIFLKKEKVWGDGSTIDAVDQRAESRVRANFSEVVLGRTVAAVKSHWHKQIFTGRSVPLLELDSDDDVIEFVRKHEGAIGYVSFRASVGDLRILRLEP